MSVSPARHASAPLEEKAFIAILRVADGLEQQAAAMLKGYGLTATQYNALRILRGGGPGGLACGEIGDRMINHDPDITRLLDRLKRRGLISRKRGQKDRRINKTFITSSGLTLLETMDRPVETFHRQLLGRVNNKRLRNLIRMLDECEGTLGKPR
ncbi:MAG: MarR family winged helix-turn-helix transcriptional regulator [Terriglobales bacterium]|jgi:DNA-binding MarR family transcriptional regulator|nr:MarR family transcriptional regulator [Terriglobales bacterium]